MKAFKFCVALGCLVFAGPSAFGQTDVEINAAIQLNFSTPGARSLGLGGAFLPIADDATAAFTNPAGLTQLSRPEVSLEGRRWSYTSVYTDRGNLREASGSGVDHISGIVEGTAEETATGLSFISFVYPKKRWVFAIYRQEVANFEAAIESEGAFVRTTSPDPQENSRLFPVQSFLDLEIVNFGISVAFRINQKLSLGGGFSYYDFSLNSRVRRFGFNNFDEFNRGGFFGGPDFSDGNLINFQTQTGDDNATGLNLGFLWKLNDRLRVGGAYRQGPEFDLLAVNRSGEDPSIVFRSVNTDFKVPDSYGIGIALQPTRAPWTIVFEYDRVEYSDVTGNVASVFPDGDDDARAIRSEDADEFHVGLEFVFAKYKIPVAVRGGAWYDPDHRPVFQGEVNSGLSGAFAALFRPGDDDVHYAAGIGFVLKRFQVDAAIDFSDRVDTTSLSAVYRF
jgi:long-chain fatty acid transport protein